LKKNFFFFSKNGKEEKETWKTYFIHAQDQHRPTGWQNNGHLFKLFNFDHELVKCDLCGKYLLGIFYQGYKCEFCEIKCHKECLIGNDSCKGWN
jgi:hypothetical protein